MQLQIDLDTEATPNNVMSTTQTVAHAWMRYAKANALKPKTKAYMYAQHAFLSGIAGLLQEDMPTILSICMATGRSLESIIERTQPR
jgi:hypothetical protein